MIVESQRQKSGNRLEELTRECVSIMITVEKIPTIWRNKINGNVKTNYKR